MSKGRKRGSGTRAPEPTLRMRVRAKNPLIERKLSNTDNTELIPMDLSPPIAAVYADEDATEIALPPRASPTGRPELPGRPGARPAPITETYLALEQTEPAARAAPRRAPEPPAPRERDHFPARENHVPREPPAPRETPHGRIPGAKVLEEEQARAKLQRLVEATPQTRIGALRFAAPHLSEAQLTELENALHGQFERTRLGNAIESPKRNLERLINEEAFQALDSSVQAGLLTPVADSHCDVETIRAAHKLALADIFGHLSAIERRQLLELFAQLEPALRLELADLAARRLHQSSALQDRDVTSNSLLTHLLAIARGPRPSPRLERLGLRGGQYLGHVLTMLAHPARLPLEDHASGVLSSIEFGLADRVPAEYGRLWRSFVSDDAVAELPGDGVLDLGTALMHGRSIDLARLETPLRLGLELLVGLAHPRSGANRAGLIMPGGHGVDADVVARALGLLYGAPFQVASGAKAALRALENLRDGPERVPPAYVSLLSEHGERLFIFDHLDRETLYFRAPHGASSKLRGARRNDPPRRVEDPETGLESILRAEAEELVGIALSPRD